MSSSPDGGIEQVVVASSNRGKLAEIRSALDFPGWRFSAARQLDDEWPSPEETGDSFEANARIKAIAARERFGFEAEVPFDDGIERTVEWWEANREGYDGRDKAHQP